MFKQISCRNTRLPTYRQFKNSIFPFILISQNLDKENEYTVALEFKIPLIQLSQHLDFGILLLYFLINRYYVTHSQQADKQISLNIWQLISLNLALWKQKFSNIRISIFRLHKQSLSNFLLSFIVKMHRPSKFHSKTNMEGIKIHCRICQASCTFVVTKVTCLLLRFGTI